MNLAKGVSKNIAQFDFDSNFAQNTKKRIFTGHDFEPHINSSGFGLDFFSYQNCVHCCLFHEFHLRSLYGQYSLDTTISQKKDFFQEYLPHISDLRRMNVAGNLQHN